MEFLDVVTIDGPVGVGKSSVSRSLAERLNYSPMDTGAMYRAFTLAAMQKGCKTKEDIAELVPFTTIELIEKENSLQVMLNGEDVTEKIRDPQISKNTSNVSDVVEVRNFLSNLQREKGKKGRYVCEGRDQGTVVFPNALWKIYLDANLETRVARRAEQLKKSDKFINKDELLEQTKVRDYRDRIRPIGALKVADDSILFDTTDFSENEVIELLYNIISIGNENFYK